MLEKKVKVVCPKCGKCMTFRNWLTWIWCTPFHWFGARKMTCINCGQTSYMRRER